MQSNFRGGGFFNRTIDEYKSIAGYLTASGVQKPKGATDFTQAQYDQGQRDMLKYSVYDTVTAPFQWASNAYSGYQDRQTKATTVKGVNKFCARSAQGLGEVEQLWKGNMFDSRQKLITSFQNSVKQNCLPENNKLLEAGSRRRRSSKRAHKRRSAFRRTRSAGRKSSRKALSGF